MSKLYLFCPNIGRKARDLKQPPVSKDKQTDNHIVLITDSHLSLFTVTVITRFSVNSALLFRTLCQVSCFLTERKVTIGCCIQQAP